MVNEALLDILDNCRREDTPNLEELRGTFRNLKDALRNDQLLRHLFAEGANANFEINLPEVGATGGTLDLPLGIEFELVRSDYQDVKLLPLLFVVPERDGVLLSLYATDSAELDELQGFCRRAEPFFRECCKFEGSGRGIESAASESTVPGNQEAVVSKHFSRSQIRDGKHFSYLLQTFLDFSRRVSDALGEYDLDEHTPEALVEKYREKVGVPAHSETLRETNNLILYGPPGTGKTYRAKRLALEICGYKQRHEWLPPSEVRARYGALEENRRVKFVTFHQSYSYEEFIEGIRPVMDDESAETGESDDGVSYEIQPGALKQLAVEAIAAGLEETEEETSFESVWSTLLERIERENESGECYVENHRGNKQYLKVTSRGNIHAFDDKNREGTQLSATRRYMRVLWKYRDELGDEYSYSEMKEILADELGTSGHSHGHILWTVLQELRALERKKVGAENETTGSDRHLRVEDAMKQDLGVLELDFDNAEQFVLLVDEVNRGNISKILGELITLLEPDKRLTGENELIVELPYSGDSFSLPPNLHLVGTMNTADRSIALLDAALRRRFRYEEMMPESRAIRNEFKRRQRLRQDDTPKSLVTLTTSLFETINRRICFLYDRDHQIGHSYFMGISSLEELRDVFVDSVIPLLQEYFYGSWNQIALVLGCPYDLTGSPTRRTIDEHAFDAEGDYLAPMLIAEELDEESVLRMDHEEYENQVEYKVNPRFAQTSNEQTLSKFFNSLLAEPVATPTTEE